jgi:hypothetical protein
MAGDIVQCVPIGPDGVDAPFPIEDEPSVEKA